MIWFHPGPDNIENGGKCGFGNIDIRNSPSELVELFMPTHFGSARP
jgi:hypothetical protein